MVTSAMKLKDAYSLEEKLWPTTNKALDKRWNMSAEGTYKGSEEKILADHYRTGILSAEGFPQVQ